MAIGILLILAGAAVAAEFVHNYDEVRIHNSTIEARLKDWRHRANEHKEILEYSDHNRIAHWRGQMKGIDLADELAGLQKLNSLINSDVHYVDDYTHFHLKDFWADPETTLEEGGDCEDIALLKAASLGRIGWPEDRMHLLVGYLTERGKKEPHAVLLAETRDGEQHILRSITDSVVLPDQFMFLPVYAVDGEGTIIVKPHHPEL
jgi:predicted transglutaminase-like cysteine proteinase